MAESKKKPSNLHIPEDIIMFNILPRLPPKSLVRFKCVCKAWLSFISQLKFHHHKLFLLTRSSIQSIDLDDESDEIRAVDLHLPFKGTPPHHRHMLAIASCNGSLCISIRREGFVIWNPFTGRSRRAASASYTPLSDYIFGFWYDHSAEDYMIVRLIDFDYSESGSKPPFRSRYSVEIYSQSSNLWQKDQILPKQIILIETKSGFLVNGVLLYWKIWYRDNGDLFNAILCYDTTHAKFDVIRPPPPDNPNHIDIISKDMANNFNILGDFKGRLCVFSYYHEQDQMHIWTKEAGKDQDWLKLLSLPGLGRIQYSPVCFIKNDEILMYVNGSRFFEGYGWFFLYSTETKNYKRVRIPNIMPHSDRVISYADSLC